MVQNLDARPTGKPHLWAPAAALVAGLILLGGCSTPDWVSVPDWANPLEWLSDDAPPPGQRSAESGAASDDVDKDRAPGADDAFPNLASVPDNPPPASSATERRAIADGLVADRENARYTDQKLRATPPVEPMRKTPATPQVKRPVAPPPPPVDKGASRPSAPQPASAVAARTPQQVADSPTPMIAAMTQGKTVRNYVPPKAPPPPPVTAAPAPPPLAATAAPPPPSTAAAPAAAYPPLVAPPSAEAPGQAPPVMPPTPGGDVLAEVYAQQLRASAATTLANRADPAFATPMAQPLNDFAANVPPIVQNTYNEALIRSAPAAARGGSVAGTTGPVFGRRAAVITFANGSARLAGTARQQIKEVADQLKARGGTARVVGHASGRTKELTVARHVMANFNISLARAQAVAQELIRRGVSPQSVFIDARGDRDRLFLEAMPSGEARNRRVEIFLEN